MRDDDNPLLQAHDLPPFEQIQAKHFLPALERILAQSRAQVAAIIKTQTPFPTWDDLVLAMDEIHARLKTFDYVLDTLASTRTEDAWTQASLDCRERLHDFQQSLARNPDLLRLYRQLADSQIARHFEPARKRALEKILQRFRQQGLNGLPDAVQADLNALERRMQTARNLFLDHLHQANKAWNTSLVDEAQLSGLPQGFRQRMANQARKAGRPGWLLTLDDESFGIVTTYADSRLLREQIYLAYSTRASDRGPHASQFDNGPVLWQLLQDRRRYASLLGYTDFAQMAIEPEQAESTAQVMAFLHEQLQRHQDAFRGDTQQLEAFAAWQGFSELHPWDYPYLAEKLREHTTGLSRQALSAWFPMQSTFSQLLLIAKDLFGVEFIERRDVPTWHSDVRLFEAREWGETIGHLYFDPFEEPGRDGYPNTTTLRNRRITAEGRPRHPIAVLHGWLPRPADDKPVLLNHMQLRILCHEFGHCLHHLLTRAEYRDISGITELSRDTCEFAGMLFEQWCFTREGLVRLSSHHPSGKPLPEEVADRILAFVDTQASWETAALLRNALFDIELHRSHGDGRTVQQVFDQISAQVGHLPTTGQERWPNALDYMVTGYAARIYAYVWSKELALKTFQRFKRDGLFNGTTGRELRETVFGPGDSRPLSESVRVFTGSEAIIAPAA